jgi:hypothetical protein
VNEQDLMKNVVDVFVLGDETDFEDLIFLKD